MICGNCGKEMPERDKFCTRCGWKVPVKVESQTEAEKPEHSEEPEKPEESRQEGHSEKEEKAKKTPEPAVLSEPPKKKRKKLIVSVIGGAAVLLVFLLVVNWAVLSNMARRTFSSPEGYYQWVERKAMQELASSVASIYANDLLESIRFYDAGGKGEITLELDDAGRDMLSLAGLAGVDLSWFEGVTFSCEGYSKNNVVQGILGLRLGKDEIISLDAIVDMEEGQIYGAVPELSKSYIGIELDEISDIATYMEANDTMPMEALKAICEKLPEEKQMQRLLSRYMDLIVECIDDVDLKTGKSLKAGGVTQTCTKLEIEIDADTVEDILKVVSKEAKDDEELEEIIIALCDQVFEQDEDLFDGLDGETVYEEFQTICRSIYENRERIAQNLNFETKMNVYVDNKGEIRGREITYSYGYYDSDLVIKLLNPYDGKDFGYKAEISDSDTVNYGEFGSSGKIIAIEGSGKDSGGKISGVFSVKYNGASIVDISAEKFDINEWKKGYPNGSFTVKADSGISQVPDYMNISFLNDLEVNLDVSMSSKKKEIQVSVWEDDERWGSVAVALQRLSSKKVSIPSGSKTIFVEDLMDLEDYWETIQWDSFLKKLDKTQLPSELVDFLENISEMDVDKAVSLLFY